MYMPNFCNSDYGGGVIKQHKNAGLWMMQFFIYYKYNKNIDIAYLLVLHGHFVNLFFPLIWLCVARGIKNEDKKSIRPMTSIRRR